MHKAICSRGVCMCSDTGKWVNGKFASSVSASRGRCRGRYRFLGERLVPTEAAVITMGVYTIGCTNVNEAEAVQPALSYAIAAASCL